MACGEDADADLPGQGCRVLVYDARDGSRTVQLRGHRAAVVCVDFDAGGGLLASCSLDMTVRVWDCETGKLADQFEGHGDSVYSV